MHQQGSPFPQQGSQNPSDVRGGNESNRAAAMSNLRNVQGGASPVPQQGQGGLAAPVSVGDKLADVLAQIIANGGNREDGAAVGQFFSNLQQAVPQAMPQQDSFQSPQAQGMQQPVAPPDMSAIQGGSAPVAQAGASFPTR